MAVCNNAFCQGKIIGNEVYVPTKSAAARSYYNTAHAAIEKRDFKKAAQYLRQAIAEDPGYIDAYDNLGLTYRQMDMLDSAEYYYLLSVKKYPKGTVAKRNLAVVEEKRGHLDKAERYLKESLEVDSKDPEAYYGLMRVYFAQKKFDAALESGKKAEQYYTERNDPYIGDCYSMLCIVYIFMNDKEKARQYVTLAKSKGIEMPQPVLDALK